MGYYKTDEGRITKTIQDIFKKYWLLQKEHFAITTISISYDVSISSLKPAMLLQVCASNEKRTLNLPVSKPRLDINKAIKQ